MVKTVHARPVKCWTPSPRPPSKGRPIGSANGRPTLLLRPCRGDGIYREALRCLCSQESSAATPFRNYDERGRAQLLLRLSLLSFPLLPRSLSLRPGFAFGQHRLLAFVRCSPLLGAGIAGAIGHGAGLMPHSEDGHRPTASDCGPHALSGCVSAVILAVTGHQAASRANGPLGRISTADYLRPIPHAQAHPLLASRQQKVRVEYNFLSN